MPGRELTVGLLVIAALIAAPLAGIGGSLLAFIGIIVTEGPGSDGDTLVTAFAFFMIIATIVSTIVIFFALLILAVPLTSVMERSTLGRGVRDVSLVGLALLIGIVMLLVTGTSLRAGPEVTFGWIAFIYAPTSALCWVAVLRYLGRPPRRVERVEERFR